MWLTIAIAVIGLVLAILIGVIVYLTPDDLKNEFDEKEE